MSHKTPGKKESRASGDGRGSSGRHVTKDEAQTAPTKLKGSESQKSQKAPQTNTTSSTRGALSEASTNVRKNTKADDKGAKKNPNPPSTQKQSSVVAAYPKKSSKPKHAPGYLTFKLSAPVNRDILNGVRASTLLRSYMTGQGAADSTSSSEKLISAFLTIGAAGYSTHLYVSVSIGEEHPYETFLLADSGSSMTTLNEKGVRDHIKKHPESDVLKHPENMNVKSRFSSTESVTGKLYRNTVTLDNTATADDQQFAVAIDPELPKGGILGIGPTSQTKGKIEGQPDTEIPTVLDNLVKNKKVKATVLGMNILPWNEDQAEKQRLSAEFHFGGIDESAIIKSTLRTIPITNQHPSSEAYGVDAELTYGGSNGEHVRILDIKNELATGIIDTGEQGILLPEKVVEEYMNTIDAEATPPQHGSEFSFWSIPRKNLLKLEPFALHFSDANRNEVTFKLPVEAQVFPPVVTDQLGLPKDRLYLTVKARPQARPGFGFVLGVPILMRLYFAIDFSNGQRVFQIAKTKHTDEESPGLATIRRELIKEEERKKAAQKGKHTEGQGHASSSKKAAGSLKGKETRK